MNASIKLPRSITNIELGAFGTGAMGSKACKAVLIPYPEGTEDYTRLFYMIYSPRSGYGYPGPIRSYTP
ncbi:hypothetical protein TPHV1_90015 [Treponema phagedenis]|uniref:Uncharacterized protein n=1 Tax=Treponema phagedenis TaxID=162 RepID=A0A0B7H350_TREPH|nr:hypothetical protein TPHV1_90015 [Treponema phagedenis]